jgi:hypothetical protein
VLFVNDLPMTTNGKVAKEELRRLIRDAVRTRGVPADVSAMNACAIRVGVQPHDDRGVE